MSDWNFLNQHRIRTGRFASGDDSGWNGAFQFPMAGEPRRVFVIASDQLGWKHVSVSFGPNKSTPSWDVMCFVKDLFWEPEEAVMQLHPPRSKWISNHPGCLHLWEPLALVDQIPLPPDLMVGIKELGELK